MARASPWTSTKVRVLHGVLWRALGQCGSWLPPPRRPARPRPRRAAAPAPVVSSLLAALIRTPLSCRPADLTLTRAIERVGHARHHRAQHRVRVRRGRGGASRTTRGCAAAAGSAAACPTVDARRCSTVWTGGHAELAGARLVRSGRCRADPHRYENKYSEYQNTVPIRMQCY